MNEETTQPQNQKQAKSKVLAIVAGLIVIALIAAGALYVMNRSDKPVTSSSQTSKQDTPKQLELKFSDLQKNYPHTPDVCLATSDDPNLKIDATDQTGIVDAAIMTMIDVPAGTKADVFIKTYDKTTATGTSIYESTWGTYNFTAQKVKNDPNSDKESWVVSKFEACNKQPLQ